MGKNGGKPTDSIMTLEEALRRFKRTRSETGAETRAETASDSNVHHVDFSAKAEPEREGRATSDLTTAEDNASANVSAQRDDANAGMPANEDIVRSEERRVGKEC